MQSWLDTQESRRSAEKSLSQNRLNRLNNRMKLFQALGGGMIGSSGVAADERTSRQAERTIVQNLGS